MTDASSNNLQASFTQLFKNSFVLTSLLAVITCILYANTLHSPFALDDYHNILANKPIRISEISFSTLSKTVTESLIERRPVANISLALNYYFHQYNVTGYHLVNIFIHIINGLLLFYFARLTLLRIPGPIRQADIPAVAFFTALLWLAHPLQTQSVTYIIQRMNSLAAMFYLLAFICYIKARSNPSLVAKSGLAMVALLSGLLAIGAKENAVMLPVFIVLYEWYFFQDLRFSLKKHHYIILSLIILFLLGAVFFYLGSNPLESLTNYGGRDFTLQERLLTEFRVVVFYISLIVLPLPSRLTLEHDFALSYSLLDPFTTLLSLVTLLLFFLAAIVFARRKRIFSFCLLWFFGNLFIESSFIPLEIIFEHRTYLPSMMLIFLFIITVYRVIPVNMARLFLLILAALLLCASTYSRNSIWQNEISLWTDIAEKAPNKARAQMNLGIILSKEGRIDKAMVYLDRAVELDPDFDLSHYSLGDALMKQGKYIQASQSYARALQLNPNNSLSRFNLGKALAAAGKHRNAIYQYRLVAGTDRLINHQVYYFMGNSYYQSGMYTEAMDAYTKALQAKPDYRDALQALQNTRKIVTILQSKKAAQQQ